MNTNKIIIYITIIAIVLLIGIPTFHKVIKENHRKLYIVSEKLITEAATKCYYEEKCKDIKITLKELYDNNYLTEEITDPVTKAVYSDSSYVLLKKDGAKFIVQ